MFKQALLITSISLLAGCAAVANNDDTPSPAVTAINDSEQNLLSRLDQIDVNLNKQTDYIASLEREIKDLNADIVALQKKQQAYIWLTRSEMDKHHKQGQEKTVQLNNKNKPQLGVLTLGALEHVTLDAIQNTFVARIDTGATTSSLNAIDMQEFERNGQKWVKFHLSDDTIAKEEQQWIETPILRHVRIRQSTSDNAERRPVVELWIKIGDVHEKNQFTLADRSQMDHPILLGREFIQDIALVDVSKEFIQKTTSTTDTNNN